MQHPRILSSGEAFMILGLKFLGLRLESGNVKASYPQTIINSLPCNPDF